MISVVICGGVGSRLWPLSREYHPKPFVRLPDGHTLIQQTYLRVGNSPQTTEILTVTNRELHFQAAEAFAISKAPQPATFLLEPVGRNTAPAIAAAAIWASRHHGPKTPLLILPADHIITDQGAFARAVARALELAEQGRLVTFGHKPTRPETGFGYIEAEGEKVLRFIEKPNAQNAWAYLQAGNFYWNAGLFCFQAEVMEKELAALAPEVLSTVSAALDAVEQIGPPEANAFALPAAAFTKAPDISIDYAIMEKTSKAAVIPCDLGWSDLGSWGDLIGQQPTDKQGNRVYAQASPPLLEDVHNCDLWSEDRLIAALGVDDLLIVDTPDALLVTKKDRAQDVKQLYRRLQAEGREEYRYHRTAIRPWGSYTILGEGPRFKIKRLEIKPGAAASLQFHHHRSEHWVVVSGMAEVTCGDKVFNLNTNESTYIKAGHWHRVINRGLIDLVIIEVQSGDYVGEDDILRQDDLYGRASGEQKYGGRALGQNESKQ